MSSDHAAAAESLAAALRAAQGNTVVEAELRAAEAMALTSARRTVRQLLPGEKIKLGPAAAVFVARVDHPIFRGLQLVTWRLVDDGETWSHDALDPDQDVGVAVPSSEEQRQANLRWALLRQGKVQVG